MFVLDLSEDPAGRFAAKLFAMSGAEVIRLVAPEAREQPEPTTDFARYIDAGKTLLNRQEIDARKLLAKSDVVFSSFDRGQHLGLGSRLTDLITDEHVHVVTSTFGTTGPYAQRRGGPMAGWAGSCYPPITGEPEREPLIGPEYLCDYASGYVAALAAEAGILRLRRGGGGSKIDISTIETMLGLHQTTFSRLAVGDIRKRTGHLAEVYPLVVRPCADGYVSLGVVTNTEFDRFCIAIERMDLVGDPRFADPVSRLAHREALDEAMDPYLRTRTGADLVEHLQSYGVASAEVFDPVGIARNPQLISRNFIVANGNGRMPGNPIAASKGIPADAVARRFETKPLARGARPLDGVRVLDFTAYWAGPMATRILADLGAEVIWVERPKSRIDYELDGAGTMPVFQYLYQWKMCRHKKSVVLDLQEPGGLEAARRLALDADIVVENFRPGIADKLGIGAAELQAANPALVYVSLSGFGADGPWRNRRSFGPNIEACSSILARTGYLHDGPLRLGHALPDGIGGLAGALAAVRGLRQREETHAGGWFDVSQLETYVALSGEDILAASLGRGSVGRIGNRSRHGAIQGIFACRGEDEWIAIRLANSEDRARLAEVTGQALISQASADEGEIEKIISNYASGWQKEALASKLQGCGIEAMPVLSPREFLIDPHLAERGFFARLSVNGECYAMPGSPLRSEPPMVDIAGTPPNFGGSTAAVLDRLESGLAFDPIH